MGKSLPVLMIAFVGAGASLAAWANADASDHYRLTGVARGATANLRAEASSAAPVVGELPGGAVCLRNLGCRDGLRIQGFATVRKAEQQRHQANPRWCQVEHQGLTGWIEGRYLVASSCQVAVASPVALPDSPQTASPRMATVDDPYSITFAQGQGTVRLKGRIAANETVDYRVRVATEETLTVILKGSHAQTYFNIVPADSQVALFNGSVSGKRFEGTVPVAGDYIIRVYLMRAAARRNAASNFGLVVQLNGAALAPAVHGSQ